jgi:hypothetical protein
MFALVTVFWILAAILIVLVLHMYNNATMACYGSGDHALMCLLGGLVVADGAISASQWLGIFTTISLVNVSLEQITNLVPQLHRGCELIRLPKSDLVYYRRWRRRLAGLGPMF